MLIPVALMKSSGFRPRDSINTVERNVASTFTTDRSRLSRRAVDIDLNTLKNMLVEYYITKVEVENEETNRFRHQGRRQDANF